MTGYRSVGGFDLLGVKQTALSPSLHLHGLKNAQPNGFRLSTNASGLRAV